MNTIRQETALNVLGVDARAFAVIAESSGRIRNQTIGATRYYKEHGHQYRITAELRFDDECKNGHETFAVTADIREDGREYAGGCCHDEIAKHFPEWAPLIKWHLCSTDGPMHYLANTLYHAGDRDHNGLRAGESRQIRNGKTGEPCWILESTGADLPRYVDAENCPTVTASIRYVPWMLQGEGKARELEHASNSAIWPEATDAELCAPDLREKLMARLPALMAEFKAAMLGAGFLWPEAREKQAA